MTPRADKVDNSRVFFYWPDTGPVEVTVENHAIVQAQGVDDGMDLWSWKEGIGNLFDGQPS